MISLFDERREAGQKPYSFAVSVLVHGAVIGLVLLGLARRPKMNNRIFEDRFTVRHLDLNTPDPRMQPKAPSKVEYPGAQSKDSLLKARNTAPGGNPEAQPKISRQIAQAALAARTLVQPDLESKPIDIPLPTFIIWSAGKTAARVIVAPQPKPAAAAEVRPSIDPPNQDANLANLSISATDLATPTPQIQPSTTSPLVVHGPDLPQATPQTSSQSSAPPTPATVMSLSDLRVKEGAVTLPAGNETAASAASGALAQGHAADPSAAGKGNPESKAGGRGAGVGQGDAANKSGSSGSAGNRNGVKIWPAQQAAAGNADGSGNQPATVHITLPISGQFGAVILGASLKEAYPETAELWSGRLAYTVYLHVGLAKSWILQYSLSREDNAAASGNIAHIDAPWPYNIVRPNIDPGAIDADALMVHGFVNQAGRFEGLTVAFPSDFPLAKFVLDSLAQWQFRPAAQNGQNIKVEVLLIIPDQEE
jgi:hypothetical protein